MQQLRQLDASMEAQMSPGRPQQGAGVAAEHKQGRRGDPRQHSDRADKWSEQEQAAFVLGLYLWGKNFPSIQQLIGSKTVRPCHRDRCFQQAAWAAVGVHHRPSPARLALKTAVS